MAHPPGLTARATPRKAVRVLCCQLFFSAELTLRVQCSMLSTVIRIAGSKMPSSVQAQAT